VTSLAHVDAAELAVSDGRVRALARTAVARMHLLVLAVTALAPLLWFARTGLVTKGVDSFFSLHPEGRIGQSLYGWDARTSAGSPAFDVITLGLNAAQGWLALAGAPLAAVQCAILLALSSTAVVGMYVLARSILRVPRGSVAGSLACAFAAVAWVVNPFALGFVWWHQLLIEFTWAVLPWLLVLLVASVRGTMPAARWAALAVLLVVVGCAAFPHAYLPGLAALCALLAIGVLAGVRPRLRAAARAVGFAAVVGLALAWWLVPSAEVLGALYAQASVGESSLEQFQYASLFSDLPKVVTLTALPHLYSTVNGVPYASWAELVTSPAGRGLSFVLPSVALIGVGAALRRRGSRGVGVVLALAFALGAFASKGLNAPFGNLNLALSELPFGAAFRHPVDKFSFLVVPPLCLLFAFGLRTLFGRRPTRPVGLAAALVVTGALAAPWWTGDVIPPGGGQLPSAWVELPASYERVGQALGRAETGGKTLVLPYSADGGAAFRWRHGIQPNLDPLLQDWAPDRSVLAKSTGYGPSDLVGEALAEGTLRGDERVFALARLWGVDRWLVHKDWASDYFPKPVTPEAATLFLANPAGVAPTEGTDRDGRAIELPAGTRTLQLYARVDLAPEREDVLLEVGPFVLQANHEGYFALRDVERGIWAPALPPPSVGQWHLLGLSFDQGAVSLSVDGVPRTERLPLDGSVPRGVTLVPACETCGEVILTAPHASTSETPLPPRAQSVDGAPARMISTPELDLWGQRALPLVYAATASQPLAEPLTPVRLLDAAGAVADDSAPVLLPPDADPGLALDPGASTSWRRLDPTRLAGSVHVDGRTLLVFGQTFDRRWRLTVEGERLAASSQLRVNGFANAWLVEGRGILDWQLSYEPQRRIDAGIMAAAALLGLGLLVLAVSLVRGRRAL
jgi:hypothetical protein